MEQFNILDIAPSEALQVARLIWPSILRKDDCFLLKAKFSEAGYQEWREKLGADSAAIEDVMNHLHLWDIFSADDPALSELADLLRTTWNAAARTQFPKEKFEVTVRGEDADYGPTIYLTTRRSAGRSSNGETHG